MSAERKEMRVGNFKVLLYSLDEVPVIEVSNLESTWMVRIPVDFQMYGMLNDLLLHVEDKEEKERTYAQECLRTYFMNWQNVTGIPSGHYHKAIVMLTACYVQPSLLKSSFWGKGKDFSRGVRKLRQDFLRWVDYCDRAEKEAETSHDGERDVLAEQAREILEKGGE